MSAAFRSSSAQHSSSERSNGPSVGDYDVYSSHTIAAQAAKTSGRTPRGAFGASARDLDWGKKGVSSHRDDGASGPTSAETASVPTTFGAGKRPPKGPSAAMGGGSRFGPTKKAIESGEYNPPALGASKSFNGNRRTSLLGTMGSSKRFNEVKVCAQGDYSDARPGAFASASKKSTGAKNTGFGGTTSRVTAFGAAAKRAEDNASSQLSYDTSSITGAFAKASEQTNKSSAAFASKSSQRTHVQVNDGPTAQSYSTADINSMAGNVNKSFNKSAQSGSGGFGTSARRVSDGGFGAPVRGADVPGPGEYAPDISDAAPANARASSAFASTTSKGSYVGKTEGAGVGDYDVHTADGMAASATKTFNKKVTGSMGTSKRTMHQTKPDVPGPGEYQHSDPSRPTVDSTLSTAKGKGTGAFASTTLRDSSQWNNFSSFLP